MNRDNLQKMADHIRNVPQDKFCMRWFRSIDGENSIKSGLIEWNFRACSIGHCISLDKDIKRIPRDVDGDIEFELWSEKFTGLKFPGKEWQYLFSGGWFKRDNTKTGAADRIEYFLKHGLPEDWYSQVYRTSELSYEK